MKRLAIYFFYDPQGIVDDYVPYFLQDLKENISELHVVCNGEVNSSGYEKLNKNADKITIRENIGYDAWAYKTVMDSYGYDYLGGFDELILLNFTIMGPLVPLRLMFDEMAARDLDFWGITEYVEINPDPYGLSKFGYLPKHIQSHFIAIRKSLLNSSAFRDYWKNLPKISSYQESICFHETVFTKNFADLGFNWGTYVGSVFDTYSDNTIITAPIRLITERHCPIFKRRSFFHNYTSLLNQSLGNGTSDLFEYIRNSTNYDENLIWQNIFRTVPQFDYYKLLKQNYILSTTESTNKPISNLRVGLVMHVYYEDLFSVCYNYALSTPEYVDMLITVSSHELFEDVSVKVQKDSTRKVSVALVENQGRDVSALLIGAKDFVLSHDLICFIHDKKVTQLDLSIKGENFGLICYQNLLYNRVFVEQVIQRFSEEERLGMLVPPIPYFAEYFRTYGNEWGSNFENVVKMAETIGLTIPIYLDKPPVAPFGTMFWFRVDALFDLFSYDWKYDKFPIEPSGNDGTISHAIERIYPLAAQNRGYFTATILSDSFAERELINRAHMLREMNIAAHIRSKGGSFVDVVAKTSYDNSFLERINKGTISREDGNRIALSVSHMLHFDTLLKIILRKLVGNRVYEMFHGMKLKFQ